LVATTLPDEYFGACTEIMLLMLKHAAKIFFYCSICFLVARPHICYKIKYMLQENLLQHLFYFILHVWTAKLMEYQTPVNTDRADSLLISLESYWYHAAVRSMTYLSILVRTASCCKMVIFCTGTA